MMLHYDIIAEYCEHTHGPFVIYLAIGCTDSPPPQVAALPGRKICILVDSELEMPLAAYKQLGLVDSSATCVETETHTFFPVRTSWAWEEEQERALLTRLHALAIGGVARMVVHDYTGRNIHCYYPLGRYNHTRLTTRILYDLTGYDHGIYTDDYINFIQIPYATIWRLNTVAPLEVVAQEAQRRQAIIMNDVHRMWRVQMGYEEARYWCTPTTVCVAAKQLFAAYDIEADTEPESLILLMSLFVMDLALAAEVDIEGDEVREVITAPSACGEPLDTLLTLLRSKIPGLPIENGCK